MYIYSCLQKSCNELLEKREFFERSDAMLKALESFCANPSEDAAKEVYKAYLYVYRIPGLNEIIDAMHRFEVTSSTLIAHHRDHYIHTVNVFLLGIALYTSNSKIREVASEVMKYPDGYASIDEEFLYRWGLTALFHDVGYPLEIAYKMIQEFTTLLISPDSICENGEIISKTNRKRLKHPIAIIQFPYIDELLYINQLPPREEYIDDYQEKYPLWRDHLPNNALEAIASRIACMGFASSSTLYKWIKRAVEQGLQNGLVDHGIFSCIILLRWINEAYSKASWNPAYFYNPAIDSATAVLLHNSYDYIFQQPPFNRGPLNITDSILGFLLMLCDNLQEFDRTSYGYLGGVDDVHLDDLLVDDGKLVLILQTTSEAKDVLCLRAEEMKKSICRLIHVPSAFQEFDIVVTTDDPQ